MLRHILLVGLLLNTLALCAQADGSVRVHHRSRLSTMDGPAQERVTLLAADTGGIWVAPYVASRHVDVGSLAGQVRFVPVAQVQELRARKRNGVFLGFTTGAILGYLIGSEVGKATSAADSTRAASGVVGGIVGTLVLAPAGAIAGLLPARFPIGGSSITYREKYDALRQRSLFKEGLPRQLRP
jgi:hypothetical protein